MTETGRAGGRAGGQGGRAGGRAGGQGGRAVGICFVSMSLLSFMS